MREEMERYGWVRNDTNTHHGMKSILFEQVLTISEADGSTMVALVGSSCDKYWSMKAYRWMVASFSRSAVNLAWVKHGGCGGGGGGGGGGGWCWCWCCCCCCCCC